MYQLSLIQNQQIQDLSYSYKDEFKEMLEVYVDNEISNKGKYTVYLCFNNYPLVNKDYSNQQ